MDQDRMGNARLNLAGLDARERNEAILADTDPVRFLNPEGGTMYAAVPDAFEPLSGFVYIICGNDRRPCKIGRVKDRINLRLSDLQIGNWNQLHLAAAVGVYDADYGVVEKVAHKMASVNFGHLRGEWFDATVEDALGAVLAAVEFCGGTARSEEQCFEYGVQTWRAKLCPEGWKERQDEERRRKLRVKLGID